MTPDDLHAAMARLADRRPVFHSEADFQHALAWQVHADHPDVAVRLERPVALPDGSRISVDMWLRVVKEVTALELKYPTRRLDATVGPDEEFRLKTGAADHHRHDMWHDVRRMERLVAGFRVNRGGVVMLSNEPTNWRTTGRSGRIDEDFRLPEGATVAGTLRWGDGASLGSIEGREDPIRLAGEYDITWHDYAIVDGTGATQFRYTVVWADPG